MNKNFLHYKLYMPSEHLSELFKLAVDEASSTLMISDAPSFYVPANFKDADDFNLFFSSSDEKIFDNVIDMISGWIKCKLLSHLSEDISVKYDYLKFIEPEEADADYRIGVLTEKVAEEFYSKIKHNFKIMDFLKQYVKDITDVSISIKTWDNTLPNGIILFNLTFIGHY